MSDTENLNPEDISFFKRNEQQDFSMDFPELRPIKSPLSFEGIEGVKALLKKNKSGVPYSNMENARLVLEAHEDFIGTIRHDVFANQILFKGQPLEDIDLINIKQFMLSKVNLHSMSKDSVMEAVQFVANKNSFNPVREWLTSLEWDGQHRLPIWLSRSLGVENSEYHQTIGIAWVSGMVRRVMDPGCQFDHVLMLTGKQGVGKTSFFRIMGGKWYKSYTGAIDNKDFYLTLRGAMLVDLDEGATLSKSDSIRIKSIITETHDEYRAPYDRITKRYPRQFVFSISTNNNESLRDTTGNRRYWPIEVDAQVDLTWLRENRDQLFAEAYKGYELGSALPQVPFKDAEEAQERNVAEDSWTPIITTVMRYASKPMTIAEIYGKAFPNASADRLGKREEMRISEILRKAGYSKKRIKEDGIQAMRWMDEDEDLLALDPLEEEFPKTA